jgi:hypothetical protein
MVSLEEPITNLTRSHRYMFYGLFMYGYQGQYSINPSYLGIGPYNLQTAGNVFAMITAVIAAALYGNIGIKSKSTILL